MRELKRGASEWLLDQGLISAAAAQQLAAHNADPALP